MGEGAAGGEAQSGKEPVEILRARLAAIVESSDDAIIGKDLDGTIVSWNPGAQRLYDYAPGEAIGRPITMLVPPGREDEIPAILERVGRGERVEHYETQRLTKDGRTIDISLTVSPIRDGSGRIVGASAIARDITERKRADEAHIAAVRVRADQVMRFLVEAGEVLGASLDYAATMQQIARLVVPRLADWCAVHLVDDAGTATQLAVTHADPAKVAWAEDLQRRYPPDPDAAHGVPQVLCTGRPEFYPEITDEMLVASARDQEHLALLRAVGMTSAMVVPLVARGRTLGAITLVAAESGRRYDPDDLAFAQELARRCAIAVDNARLYAELEQRVADRTAELTMANQELEAFSYSVSHDLRAPLRAIDGFSRILLEDYQDELPAGAQRYLNIIRDSTVKMGQLVDDLLAFSRLGRQPLRTQTVDPAAIARRVIDELSRDLDGRRVEFVLGELPPCEADPSLLKQVFANLIGNAVKFTRSRDAARVEIGAECEAPPAGQVAYFVRDNGVGFDVAYAHKLFGVFQRLHRAEDYEGTGVGLAIVQRIVQRHGGRVWAEGEPDRGATFWLTLPAPPPEVATSEGTEEPAGARVEGAP